MRTTSIIITIIVTAVSITFCLDEAKAVFSAEVGAPNINIRISDYQPAPAGVYIRSDRGRPYYVERDRQLYMEKRKRGKHYKNEKKHHEEHGREKSHDRHDH